MEAAPAAAAAVRGGSLVRARVSYGRAQGPRRVGGVGGLAALGCRRVLVAVAGLPEVPEPLPSHAQDGAVSPAPRADGEGEEDELEVHRDAAAAAETSFTCGAPESEKTVRVRFVLKQWCPFGQSFHLVGDHPALGLWDPLKAVAMQWTEGHEWTVERDLPANKVVEFKFLLRDTLGNLHWQSGPNRSLQIGETVKTLIIYEDWGDMSNQKIEEEGGASIGMDAAVVSNDDESGNYDVLEDELQMHDNKKAEQHDNNEVEQVRSIVRQEDQRSAFATTDSDQGESMKANTADPPKPFPLEEQKMLGQLDEKIDNEGGYISCADGSKSEKTEEENILPEVGVQVENGSANVYDHDFHWGWKALQQLMMSLDFKKDTS